MYAILIHDISTLISLTPTHNCTYLIITMPFTLNVLMYTYNKYDVVSSLCTIVLYIYVGNKVLPLGTYLYIICEKHKLKTSNILTCT